MDDESGDGTITVMIAKRKLGGVGFVTSRRNASPYLAVSHVVKGGVAHETGLIQAGDVILEVNGNSLESVPYHKALEILDKVPTGEEMVIQVRAKDGFQAYLETAFDDKGAVKTVRKTRATSPSIADTNKNNELNGEVHEPMSPKRKSALANGPDASKEQHVVNEVLPTPAMTNDGLDHDTRECESEIHSESSGITKCPVTNFISKPQPQQPKYVRLQNLLDGRYTTDTLHQKAAVPTSCTSGRCMGSLMIPYGGEAPPKRLCGVPREPEEVKVQAKDFLQQYYGAMKLGDSPAHKQRLAELKKEIAKNGTYDLTEKELIFGCRMAWRNASRCIGRIQWNKLQVFDARHVNTPSEMYDAICKHIKYGTNKGNLRSTITVFPQRKTAFKDFRVWNTQLIRYAGYKQPDGSCIGDPSNIEFTEICETLGWKGKGGRFDVLPLVLQANGGEPEMFEIPPEIILEVEMKHPKYPWFEELGLKWYALPAVSCLCLDVGGVEMPACPFNGWYMVTEIGARDFGDANRYNMLEPVALRMGLDTKSYTSLWKDLALVEINVAVMYSFQEAGVTITDHHSASESFLKHVENENKLRGGCPGDWVWIVPPMSGSVTPVFHQEMLNYLLKPSYEYQDDPWKHYSLKKDKQSDSPKKKASFKEVAKAVKFSAKLMSKALAKRQKAVILYATETGKSERYAKMLGQLFSHAFDPKVICMEEYAHPEMENEQLVLIVTSTFGNGDPPENGEGFARYLYELRHPPNGSRSSRNMLKQLGSLLVQMEKERGLALMNNSQPLANLRYSVFGLGSRAYPNFCAFARSLDKIIRELGGEPVLKMGEGDELCGQEESFKVWAKDVFKAACDSFCVGEEITKEASQSLDTVPSGWVPGRFRLAQSVISAVGAFSVGAVDRQDGHSGLTQGLSHICGKAVRAATLLSVKNLQSAESSRSTISVKFKTENSTELQYKPGDHVAIFPANRPELVQGLIDKLSDDFDPDKPIVVEALREDKVTAKKWEAFSRLPSPVTVRQALSRYLDITSVPSPQILKFLATIATDQAEKEKLEILGEGNNRYEDWKFGSECNILDVLQEFPSLKIPADLVLTQLPLLQPRFYSISSSPDLFPGEIHLTVAVVQYNKKGGKGPVHHGVCSTWLDSLQPGDKVPCYVRQAQTFHMPDDSTVPVIMVGPGTGIAPFRSFWQQRQFDISNKCPPKPKACDVTPESSPRVRRRNFAVTGDDSPDSSPRMQRRIFTGNTSLQRQIFSDKDEDATLANSNTLNASLGKWGEMLLFFGCRNSTQDYIYKEEMAQAKDEGALTEIWAAHSREPQQPKRYVQDMLKQEAFEICEKILSQKAHFYVCGDVSMAEDVCRTLQTLLQEFAAMSQQEAQETVDKMKLLQVFPTTPAEVFAIRSKKDISKRALSSGRYHEDIFGVTLKTKEVTDRVRTAAKRSWMYLKASSRMTLRIEQRSHRQPLAKPPTCTITVLKDEDGVDSIQA